MKRKYIWTAITAVLLLSTAFAVPALALTEGEVEARVASSGKEAVAGNVLIWLLCAVAFLKVSQKIDSFLASLGVNVGHTGGSLMAEVLIATRAISMMAGSAGHALGGMGRNSLGSTASSGGASGLGGYFKGGLVGMASRRAANNAVRTATGNSSFRGSTSTASKAATPFTSTVRTTASTAGNGASGQKPIVQGNTAPGGSAGNAVPNPTANGASVTQSAQPRDLHSPHEPPPIVTPTASAAAQAGTISSASSRGGETESAVSKEPTNITSPSTATMASGSEQTGAGTAEGAAGQVIQSMPLSTPYEPTPIVPDVSTTAESAAESANALDAGTPITASRAEEGAVDATAGGTVVNRVDPSHSSSSQQSVTQNGVRQTASQTSVQQGVIQTNVNNRAQTSVHGTTQSNTNSAQQSNHTNTVHHSARSTAGHSFFGGGDGPKVYGIGGRMFMNSLSSGGEFANEVIGRVAQGDIQSTGTITGQMATQALNSYMGITALHDNPQNNPTFTNVEIGGGRISGSETAPGGHESIQFCMYHTDQYTAPEGDYTKVVTADGATWYKQYAQDTVDRKPYSAPDGTVAYNETIVKRMPRPPQRKNRM